jgi:hypothetical protein
MERLPKHVRDVNTTDVRDAIRLGCRVMERVFNADDDKRVPFFGGQILPEARMAFGSCHGESHVPGRHLNALLNAEDAAGIQIDESAVETHARAALFSHSGPVALALNRRQIGGPLVNFCPHNLREGMHALYALVRFRDSKESGETAERCIAAILDLWKPDRGWDVDRIQSLGLNYEQVESFIHGEARLIGPLVKYYRATRSGAALKLALLMKQKAVDEFFLADGGYDRKRFACTHSHSITCTMSSLAQLAELLGDISLLMRVKAFYDNGLWEMRDEIGWSPEIVGQRDTDHGEANNTGDILETALILGRHGFPDYYHDAERIIRCHLLPSQLRDVSFAIESPNPEQSDGLRDVPSRLLGAFGMPATYGHSPSPNRRGEAILLNLDIVGGAVASLCEAYRAITRFEEGAHWVNLLFDHETEFIRVESPYTHDAIRVTVKKPGPLFLRGFRGGFQLFPTPTVGQPLTLAFPLPEEQITLSDRVHPRPIRVALRGDSVVAMENFGAPLAFFPNFS